MKSRTSAPVAGSLLAPRLKYKPPRAKATRSSPLALPYRPVRVNTRGVFATPSTTMAVVDRPARDAVVGSDEVLRRCPQCRGHSGANGSRDPTWPEQRAHYQCDGQADAHGEQAMASGEEVRRVEELVEHDHEQRERRL